MGARLLDRNPSKCYMSNQCMAVHASYVLAICPYRSWLVKGPIVIGGDMPLGSGLADRVPCLWAAAFVRNRATCAGCAKRALATASNRFCLRTSSAPVAPGPEHRSMERNDDVSTVDSSASW